MEQNDSNPLTIADLLANIKFNRVLNEGDLIYKFMNNSIEIQLLNYMYLFYLDENRQLFSNGGLIHENTVYDLYFQEVQES
jgi:hypothetical protein